MSKEEPFPKRIRYKLTLEPTDRSKIDLWVSGFFVILFGRFPICLPILYNGNIEDYWKKLMGC
ncbi:MAG TPA: hypothetical protein DEF35_02440 [Paenibacillus sp.]|nr:hypothetical protein CA599_22810 [Paenibacillus taichungensis]HBU80492.1 hypothetical protein [Paenibacillus sp.]